MPRIEDILDQLASAHFITVLDLKDAYSNIELDDESKAVTAFTIPSVGHMEYCCVPFGVKDTGFAFQQLIELALNTAHCEYVSAYLDDVIIYSPDFDTHLKHLGDVLHKLQKAGIKLAPNKCQFCQCEVQYLGHILSPDGLKPVNSTVQCIQSFPTPKNQKEVKAYLGLAGFYRRFIANFAEIAYPLHLTLQTEQNFVWTQDQQDAFDHLKHALAQDVILKFPRFDQPFQLVTDASQHAIGAVLSQEHNGIQQPVTFYSWSLRKHEKNYTVTEKEGLAAVTAVKVFDFYLHDQPFGLIIDHTALQHIFSHTRFATLTHGHTISKRNKPRQRGRTLTHTTSELHNLHSTDTPDYRERTRQRYMALCHETLDTASITPREDHNKDAMTDTTLRTQLLDLQ